MQNTYGYFYCGNYVNQQKYGIAKIGITAVAPSVRRGQIEYASGHKFRIQKYVRILDVPKQDLLFVEAWVRRAIAKTSEVTYDEQSNDHYTYTIKQGLKYDQINTFANLAISYAIEALQFMGYNKNTYKIKECK